MPKEYRYEFITLGYTLLIEVMHGHRWFGVTDDFGNIVEHSDRHQLIPYLVQ